MSRDLCSGPDSLPKPVVGWICNHAAKNFWRVAKWYELDDLIQDGIVVAYKCRAKYGVPGKDIDPPHFMALVKTAFYRHITELLRRSRAEEEVTDRIGDVSGEESDESFLDRCAESVEGLQEFATFLARMPVRLRAAVAAYLAPEESGETDAQRMKRLAGFPLRHDFETELRASVWEQQHAFDDEESAESLILWASKFVSLSEPVQQLLRLSFRPADECVDNQVATAIRRLVLASRAALA